MKRFYILLVVVSLILLTVSCSPVRQKVMSSEDASEVDSIRPTPLEYNPAVYWEYHDSTLKITGSGPQLGGSAGTGFEYRYSVARNATSLIVDGSITYISAYGFSAFDYLKDATFLAPTLSEVGMGLFAHDKQLVAVSLTETILQSIPAEFCTGCVSLTSIELPSTITSIDSYAFEGCVKLTNISFAGTMEQWNAVKFENNAFEGCSEIIVTCADGTVIIKGDSSN